MIFILYPSTLEYCQKGYIHCMHMYVTSRRRNGRPHRGTIIYFILSKDHEPSRWRHLCLSFRMSVCLNIHLSAIINVGLFSLYNLPLFYRALALVSSHLFLGFLPTHLPRDQFSFPSTLFLHLAIFLLPSLCSSSSALSSLHFNNFQH